MLSDSTDCPQCFKPLIPMKVGSKVHCSWCGYLIKDSRKYYVEEPERNGDLA